MSEPAGAADSAPLITTYRYLRMSLIAVLAMLAIAVALQTLGIDSRNADPRWGDPHWETSISAYYWTPVRSVFVGSLLAMGVGMVILKADNEIEDLLLNVGGCLAPMVAFVPTPLPCVESPSGCAAQNFPRTILDGIANNVLALILASLLALVLFLALAGGALRHRRTDPIFWVRAGGVATVGVLWVAFAAWFLLDDVGFSQHAHIRAAVLLFVCVILVLVLNAVASMRGRGTGRRAYLWIYGGLAGVMFLAVLVGAIARLRPVGTSFLGLPHQYALLWIEASVLSVYLVFWIVQSVELWRDGTRWPGRPDRIWPVSRR